MLDVRKPQFLKAIRRLKRFEEADFEPLLEKLGADGVAALSRNTPKDSGETAGAWSYKVIKDGKRYQVVWTNSVVTSRGVPIVLLLQYGHTTGNGGYVPGRDFINPALAPLVQRLIDRGIAEVIL